MRHHSPAFAGHERRLCGRRVCTSIPLAYRAPTFSHLLSAPRLALVLPNGPVAHPRSQERGNPQRQNGRRHFGVSCLRSCPCLGGGRQLLALGNRGQSARAGEQGPSSLSVSVPVLRSPTRSAGWRQEDRRPQSLADTMQMQERRWGPRDLPDSLAARFLSLARDCLARE